MQALDRELVDTLRRLDSCAVSNAIETFDVRLRNEGFADGRVRAVFDDLPPVVGRAVTARIRSSTPPPVGHSYYDRTDWWTYVATVPPPRLVVVEDIDERPGLGAFVGEVHANILRALECVGYATNGSVRDLPAVHRTGFAMFAGSLAVSHAFVHVVDFGTPVQLGGLTVASGDIVFGDRHGLIAIPDAIVADVARVATAMLARERAVIDFCQSGRFSLDGLRGLVKGLG